MDEKQISFGQSQTVVRWKDARRISNFCPWASRRILNDKWTSSKCPIYIHESPDTFWMTIVRLMDILMSYMRRGIIADKSWLIDQIQIELIYFKSFVEFTERHVIRFGCSKVLVGALHVATIFHDKHDVFLLMIKWPRDHGCSLSTNQRCTVSSLDIFSISHML